MGLIKSEQAPAAAMPFSMKDIEQQARGLLAAAQRRAEALLAAAQAEGESLKAQAHAAGAAEGRAEGLKRGREDGLKAGREQALSEHREKLGAAIAALNKACGDIESSRRQLETSAVRDVIDLAVAIAQRVTRRLGETDPKVLMGNVREAMKLASHASDVRIAVNPVQRSTLADAMGALKLEMPALGHVEIVEDAAVAPGGCRIFTQRGEIDAGLDEQLQRICADLAPGQQAGRANTATVQ